MQQQACPPLVPRATQLAAKRLTRRAFLPQAEDALSASNTALLAAAATDLNAQPEPDTAAPLQHCIRFRCRASGEHVDEKFKKELLRMLGPALGEYAQSMKDIAAQRSGSTQRVYPPGDHLARIANASSARAADVASLAPRSENFGV
jgi:hypothetical protein